MGRKRKDRTAEVMEELYRLIAARPDGVVEALLAGTPPEELSAIAAVKCKRGADGACEWEIKPVDRLKAIELYLKYREGAPEPAGPSPGVVVEYDYG